MRRFWGLLAILSGTLFLVGCPGSNRGDNSILLPDGYRWPSKDITVADNTTIPELPDQTGTSCESDEDCQDGWVCNPETGMCVECLLDEHCPEGFECKKTKCQEILPPCVTDEDCPEGMLCNPHSNTCVECMDDDDCEPEQWCDLEEGECVEDVCVPGQEVCMGGGVAECKENGSGFSDVAVCPEGTFCENGECIPVPLCEEGDSQCLTETAYKLCAAGGTFWEIVECGPNQMCQETNNHAKCVVVCTPDCTFLEMNTCGPDGCVGLCDFCAAGFECPEGAKGLPPGSMVKCEPKCTCQGKQCGDDGCGNWCGECKPGYVCQAGQCSYVGYDCAQGWECMLSCNSMPNDLCVEKCVAATDPGEVNDLLELLACVMDFCGGQVVPGCAQEVAQGACEKQSYACLACEPDCLGKECGDNGCGSSCGQCDVGFECIDNVCEGQGHCSDVLSCIENSEAPPDVSIPYCMAQSTPDAQAQFLKLATCIQDACGEFVPFSNCYMLAIQSQDACLDLYQMCKSCSPQCIGKECGPDGCNGYCGYCQDGFDCDSGKCVCIANCASKECGPDGCGGVCGMCAPNFVCTDYGKCKCTPDCVNKDCGGDGCGGGCGSCPPGQECTINGSCLPAGDCQPGMMECDGNELLICGADGQWVSLGMCPEGSFCDDGVCVPWACVPGDTICVGNGVATCADNGAGWLPAQMCPQNTLCKGGKCVPASGCGDVSEVGCCDGNTLMKCLGNQVEVKPCGNMGCGWVPGIGYDCGGMGADPSGQFPQYCSCEPDCDGKQCGDDGCGTSCGQCQAGSVCEDGLCIPICLPKCGSKKCGPDDCGGVCGLCQANQECVNGACLVPPDCESMLACAQDCFPMGDACFAQCSQGASGQEYAEFKALWECVWQSCAPSSNPNCWQVAMMGACYQNYLACISCAPKCAGMQCGPDGCGGACGKCLSNEECVNGTCVPVCLPQCAGKECGSNGCNGLCGVCKPGYECEDGQCIFPCQAQCLGKECGSDGCGGNCGLCPPGSMCNNAGICDPILKCGDGVCSVDAGENCINCQPDCGPCSDGCEATQWPGCGGCPCEACVCAMDPYCCEVAWDMICVNECKSDCGGCCSPTCNGNQCGPDGCGGSCGKCPAQHECIDGGCIPVCTPDCDGKECGTDGCGGTCGVCKPNETCKNSVCFSGKPCGELVQCALDCVSQMGVQCMYDCLEQGTPEAQTEFSNLVECVVFSCGLNLTPQCMLNAMTGPCSDEYNECLDCTPDCAGKQCGPNGCGGTCGLCQDGYYCENYKCKFVCNPSCGDAAGMVYECGSNGCGGSCGTCPADEKCQNHQCVPDCVPQCQGKQCGSDGCGGQCGVCPPGFICGNGMCQPVGPMCGDGECDFWDGEDCTNCPPDCGPCGNGCVETQWPGCGGCKCEGCVCSMDPYCCDAAWDSICVSECYECGGCGCTPQCGGKQCGPDGCGGNCGKCPPDHTCQAGKCVFQCFPNCMGKQCGSDGCGGSCGKCPEGFYCSGQGLCEPVCTPNCSGKQCGPDGCNGLCGLCGPDEACLNGQCIIAWDCEQLLDCAWDCPEGDEACTGECWDNASPEAQEQYIMIWQCVLEVCGPEPQEPCPGQAIMWGECKDEFNACLDCTPNCTGKQCGPDGCQGICGECPPGYECDAYGYCDCIPNCTGKMCGPDGCGGICGECQDGFVCNNKGNCVCMPDCLNKECGSDGCGGLCGACPGGYMCEFGKCVQQCKPQCFTSGGQPKQCGPDGCGGQCGFCPPGLQCNPQGQCQQVGPVCGNGQCESNGGENCLTCPGDCGNCGGDCCQPHNGVGCSDKAVTKCVCAMDSFCCEVSWDSLCVDEAINDCKANCGCIPNCAAKQCGPDGCGGQCGFCQPNATCNSQGQCIPSCQPKCEGKQCGPDGCGNTCGACELGYLCNSQGQCVCQPDCWGKECGSDGCGGSCGQCTGFMECTPSGKCAIVTPLCGDGNCMQFIGENCDSCPQDCGQCCGNDKCETAYLETCKSCPQDCGQCCGNDFCDTQLGETCSNCPADCGPCPAKCGDQQCEPDKGESCSNCPIDCGPCPAQCGNNKCESAVGENCQTCPQDCGQCAGDCCEAHDTPGCADPQIEECVCKADGYCCQVAWDSLCVDEVESLNCGLCSNPGACGDGLCMEPETCSNCPQDCGQCCGNGQCDAGESCQTCQQDCGWCPGEYSCCTPHDSPGCLDPEVEACVCGMDPFCCNNNWDGLCASEADQCGSCSGNCCAANNTPGCDAEEVEQCVCKTLPNCCDVKWDAYCASAVKSLGCGSCSCMPDCQGKECGPDGCGSTCGICPDGQECLDNGQCAGGQQGDSCSEILQCATTNCAGDFGCVMECYNQGNPDSQQIFWNLMTCVFGACGMPPSTQCMIQSFMFQCNQQYQACSAD